MIPEGFDSSIQVEKLHNAVNDTQNRISMNVQSLSEYQDELDRCAFETRDILRKMQEDSIRESRYNRRANFIIIAIALLTLVATVVFGLGLL